MMITLYEILISMNGRDDKTRVLYLDGVSCSLGCPDLWAGRARRMDDTVT